MTIRRPFGELDLCDQLGSRTEYGRRRSTSGGQRPGRVYSSQPPFLKNSGEVQKCKQLDFVFRISAKNAELIPRKN
jgi:hypothetical protein